MANATRILHEITSGVRLLRKLGFVCVLMLTLTFGLPVVISNSREVTAAADHRSATSGPQSKNDSRTIADDRPNIVLILADDQSYRDFGFLGNRSVHTPHIDRIAAGSARYPNGYVPMSVCRPSLATLLTGLYPHQHGIHFNHPPPGLNVMRKTMTAAEYQQARATTDYLIQGVPTLPRILARHGYACLQTGKHWEGDSRTAGFTHGMTQARPADRLGQITGTRTQTNGEWGYGIRRTLCRE